MKGIQSNGFLPIIAQAIAEMEELHGEFASINEINLAELGRRTGISRAKLRRLKANGFCETPHGLIIVCLAALAALHTEEKQEQIKTSGETVLSIEPAKVTALSWEQDGTTLSFHRGDDGWQYDDDAEFPVSDSAMDALLEQFYGFGASFTIENAEDLSQYGLDEPTCTITLTTDDETYMVKLGDYSTMDSQRYVDIGDGNVYLAASDPLDAYDVELKDLIANDDVPYFNEVSQIHFAGSEDYSVIYDENGKSICADDVYFTADGKPLDTSLLDRLPQNHSLLVTVEENVKSGGFGEHVSAYMEACHPEVRVLPLAIP
ncbi:MAG: DUF4340 domain-containing protein, partial [Clostridiales bacterium]|nr:DUF4340 domain-containing protein [Clostridiales bacterium]